jgi:hypothetical protein
MSIPSLASLFQEAREFLQQAQDAAEEAIILQIVPRRLPRRASGERLLAFY